MMKKGFLVPVTLCVSLNCQAYETNFEPAFNANERYETNLNIRQYSADGTFHFTLKVTDVMNQDYYYDGSAPTLDGVMNCIKIFLKNHQN